MLERGPGSLMQALWWLAGACIGVHLLGVTGICFCDLLYILVLGWALVDSNLYSG